MSEAEFHPPGTVFVDPLFVHVSRDPHVRRTGERHEHRWCHMWSDDLDALHAMATRIGMKREWFQDREGFPHYDLLPELRDAALRLGAVEKKLRAWLRGRRAG